MFMSLLITAPVTVIDYYGVAEDILARRHSCCQAKRTVASGLLARRRSFCCWLHREEEQGRHRLGRRGE